MSQIEGYRKLYEYEKDCDDKMLTMIESVPEANRTDPRFQQAVTLADHLAACRENWLTHMRGDTHDLVAWWDESSDLSTLPPRFTALEVGWTDYLNGLDDTQLAQGFTFSEGGGRYTLPTEGQVMQLVGHALYHRGQIALLVDQLGGETVDTDYIYWLVPESR
ncbi:MAG: hypothetical protein JWN14_4577 [Chthonomonadales bacterium]|nr:hypothetical protein [Chthonomonadales bacterium]